MKQDKIEALLRPLVMVKFLEADLARALVSPASLIGIQNLLTNFSPSYINLTARVLSWLSISFSTLLPWVCVTHTKLRSAYHSRRMKCDGSEIKIHSD